MALFKTFAALFASVVLVTARDGGKFLKTVPTISNSLVNLGKMEISIHINGPTPAVPDYASRQDHSFQLLPSPKETENSCACSDFKPPASSFLTNPSEVINKILKSNDLFKDPTSSVCCGSHEHGQESTLFVELIPNQNTNVQRTPQSPIFHFPHFEKLFKPTTRKSKQVDILLFPKRKDLVNFEFPNFAPRKKDIFSKNDFRIVGDLDLGSQSTSVKKDLTLSEKQNDQELRNEVKPMVTPANNLATNNNNAL